MKINSLNQLYSDREIINAALVVTVGGFDLGFASEILLAVSVPASEHNFAKKQRS